MTSNYHTIILSDIHLSDAEPENIKSPLWKKFRRKEYFIDQSFSDFLSFMSKKINDKPIELILNGDIFDFDSVMAMPENANFSISSHEKIHGLNSTQEKSVYKIKQILKDHHVWVKSLAEFIEAGNKIIFIIGNHDVELNWPEVQSEINKSLVIDKLRESDLIFCEWFYVSNKDTLVEHGNQYDPYCLCLDPVNPIISKRGEYRIRLPFGNLANRFMANNMGLKNPHSDDAFLKSTFEFVKFFYKYEMRVQPFMIVYWITGATRTFVYSLVEGLLPSLKDPLTFSDRIEAIAIRSNSTTSAVLTLKQNHAHPAALRPFMMLRELWLDRASLMVLIVWACWQFFTTSALFSDISLLWFLIPLGISIPFFLYYAHGVQSDVHNNTRLALDKAPLSAQVVGVKRIVHGHTHYADHKRLGDSLEYINTGAWTPIFEDPECLKPKGVKYFCWIDGSKNREMNLFVWDGLEIELSKYSERFHYSKDSE